MVGEKSKGKRWGWVVGALIALFVAVALTSTSAPKFALFGRSNKPCNCTQVWLLTLLNWASLELYQVNAFVEINGILCNGSIKF